jgi:hypothetical protein
MSQKLISLGAINKETNQYEYPSVASKEKRLYKCPDCDEDLILRRGKKLAPHFAHFAKKVERPCYYYHKPSESQIHKDAKQLLKTLLERKVFITIVRRCQECDMMIASDSYPDDETDEFTVYTEYKFEHNKSIKSADVALIYNKKSSSIIFEIYQTHRTAEKDRPEPWYEINAKDLIIQANTNDEIQIDCCRLMDCETCKQRKEEQKRLDNIQRELQRKRETQRRLANIQRELQRKKEEEKKREELRIKQVYKNYRRIVLNIIGKNRGEICKRYIRESNGSKGINLTTYYYCGHTDIHQLENSQLSQIYIEYSPIYAVPICTYTLNDNKYYYKCDGIFSRKADKCSICEQIEHNNTTRQQLLELLNGCKGCTDNNINARENHIADGKIQKLKERIKILKEQGDWRYAKKLEVEMEKLTSVNHNISQMVEKREYYLQKDIIRIDKETEELYKQLNSISNSPNSNETCHY